MARARLAAIAAMLIVLLLGGVVPARPSCRASRRIQSPRSHGRPRPACSSRRS